MKRISIMSLMASLAILGIGAFIKPQSVSAEPASIFRPLLQDIETKLPSNLVFRLPSRLPEAITRKMSPQLTFDVNSERAYLALEDKDCLPRFRRGGRGFALACIRFSVASSTLASKYYQEDGQRGESATVVQLSRNLRGYHFQGDGWNTVSWVQDNTYFKIYSGTVRRNELIEVARSMIANSQVIGGRSFHQIAQQPKPQLITWKQFIQEGGGRYIQNDYDLPPEFRNGYVYFNYYGASTITAYILKQSLSSYPPIQVGGRQQIDSKLADEYIKSGRAIALSWTLSNGIFQRYGRDPEVRFSGQRGSGCLALTCLEAPFLTNEQISRILRSGKAIPQKK